MTQHNYPPIQPQVDPGVWQPEGMRPFQVGDRVQVRLSGECQVEGAPTSHDADHGFRGHRPAEHGMTGTVTRQKKDNQYLHTQGHLYQIDYDTSLKCALCDAVGGLGSYAAAELVLLEEA